MRFTIQYMDGSYETFETDDADTINKAISHGRGIYVTTKATSAFASEDFFIPFTAIKRIAIKETT